MKMKKLDMTVVKNYLFHKGERVGLLVCAVIAVSLLGIGLMKAGGHSTPWAENIKKMREPLERQINVTAQGEKEIKTPQIPPQWPFHQPNFAWIELSPNPDAPDNLRRNPTILKIMDDAKHMQVDVVVGGYFANELDLRGQRVVAFANANKNGPARAQRKGGGGNDDLTKIMKPAHMVVVSAVFPMYKQYEEYQRQLHYATLAALLADPDYTPRPLGITVYRREVKNDDKNPTWDPKPVYRYNAAEDKAEAEDRITNLFREAVIDEDNPKALSDYVISGLVTPLPELANKEYRPLKLQGINLDEAILKDKGADASRWAIRRPRGFGNMPVGRGNVPNQGANIPAVNHIPWKDLDPALSDKFMGKIDFFDPTGRLDATVDPQNPANQQQPTPFKRARRGGPKAPADPGGKIEIKDALVRFIDVDVQPGKTYQYTFCIHMANPNYEKKELVAYQELAKKKELLSPFAYSPLVTIPGEYYYYAHDEPINSRIERGSDWKNAKAEPPVPYGRWNTAIQIHNWIGKVAGADTLTVADWAIAERLLTRRGDVIGRNEVIVEVPTWNKDTGTFEIGFQRQNAIRKNQPQNQTGLPISFVRGANPPLLVDFEGGKKSMVKIGGTVFPKDESAVDILVLTPDNKLVVRNSRDDADPDNPVAAARQARVDIWNQELQRLRKSNNNNGRPAGFQVPQASRRP